MSSKPRIAEFPNVEAKLQQPRGPSAFERQRAEAEAKRKREAAETAAVYEDFVKSFDHDGEEEGSESRPGASRLGGPPERPPFANQGPYGGGASGGRRHFGLPAGPSMRSGPGSLGPGATSFGKKRTYDGFQSNHQREREDGRGRLGFGDPDAGVKSVPKAFDTSDDDEKVATVDRAEEKATSRPTLRLANLPPGTSPAVIKALIPTNLIVENVKVVPSSGPAVMERKSIAAIVTLSKDSPATEIDAAVSSLQGRYLGYGFSLSLHRHLSSAAISSSSLPTLLNSTSGSQPFGAKRVAEPNTNSQHQPGGFGRDFAPPSSYGPPGGGPVHKASLLHVPVQPPKDIKKLRMIHKVVESILEHGPEFEALLMSRPDVQREEKWAWLWDARSDGGVWYRWRLWEIVTGSVSKPTRQKFLPLFEGSHAWKAPDQPLSFEFTTGVNEFVSDSEYNSSDLEEDGLEQTRPGDGVGIQEKEDTFLNPIEKSKLAHFLARLPKTLSKLRKGDIARITAFAITHASRGSDEIVDMIVSNITRPFSYTAANPDHRQDGKDKDPQPENQRDESPSAEDKASGDAPDTSAARLLGLYVVSDILSCSSTSGIRHAWRYRQLFENALRSRKIFEMLGGLPTKLEWGRLRAEKWKRSIGLVLSLWEGWCVFPVETHAFFLKSFEEPPVPRKETRAEDNEKKIGRWKTVDASAAGGGKARGFRPVSDSHESPQEEAAPPGSDLGDSDTHYETYSDIEYSDLDELLADESLDGLLAAELHALLVSASEDTPMAEAERGSESTAPAPSSSEAREGLQSRKRMRAMDMFANSGSEDEG